MTDHLNFERLKEHLRLEQVEDIEALKLYADASLSHALRYVRRTEAEMLEIGGGVFPPDFINAVYLLTGHYYRSRETVTAIPSRPIPYGHEALLRPFRRLTKRK